MEFSKVCEKREILVKALTESKAGIDDDALTINSRPQCTIAELVEFPGNQRHNLLER